MSLILYDARCPLCTFWVLFVARRDGGKYSFVPITSAYGKQLCKRLRIDPYNPGTFALIQGKRARYRAIGILTILGSLPGYENLAATVALLPKPVLNTLYGFIARTRYVIFGRYPKNYIPAQLKGRILEKPPVTG